MRQKISIQRAEAEDLKAVAPLFDAYRQFYGQASDPEGAHSFLSERLRNGESVIFLITVEQGGRPRPAGFTQLYPFFSSSGMRRVWVLNDLFVTPDQRRAGLARRLLVAAREFAESTGAGQIRLATARDNLAASSLYESLGYRLDDTFDHYSLEL